MSGLSDAILWKNIKSHELDKPGVSLPFTARLAKETGWTPQFTKDVCEEYKRFIYLLCVSGKMLAPSEEVDKAWHLHLTYTRAYWQEFCRGVLGREIHHMPAEGGEEQTETFREAYVETLAVYKKEFGSEPPNEIWPPVEIRYPPFLTMIDNGRIRHFDKGGLTLGLAMLIVAGAAGAAFAAGAPKHLIIVGAIFGFVLLAMAIDRLPTWQSRKSKDSGGGGCSSTSCGGGGCGGD